MSLNCLRLRLIFPVLVAGVSFFAGVCSEGMAQPTPTSNPAEQKTTAAASSDSGSSNKFMYEIEGRPDPFLPFVSDRATANENPDEIVDENQLLTGMQLFEPGQLNLVALMQSNNQKLAMVQDFTGKGYVITEGTKIGRRGVVSEIQENKVVITETARTRSGQELTNTITMVLKKEGEE